MGKGWDLEIFDPRVIGRSFFDSFNTPRYTSHFYNLQSRYLNREGESGNKFHDRIEKWKFLRGIKDATQIK